MNRTARGGGNLLLLLGKESALIKALKARSHAGRARVASSSKWVWVERARRAGRAGREGGREKSRAREGATEKSRAGEGAREKGRTGVGAREKS